MAWTSRMRTIGRVGGVAATTALYVRRLAKDDELRADVRPRHYVRPFVIGTGLFFMAVGAGIALAWPRARQQVTRAVDQTTTRAGSTVHDIRERIAGQREERAA